VSAESTDLRSVLGLRWAALVGRAGWPRSAAGVGERLLDAYASPARSYHDLRHLAEVLDHVEELAGCAAHPDTVLLAAWFHDAVYAGTPRDEQDSAVLAADLLSGVGAEPALVDEVCRLVRLTADHQVGPGDSDGAVLCDADLAVLARDVDGYRDYLAAVRREYPKLSDATFRAGRDRLLAALLARPSLFATEPARRAWESAARANVAAELDAGGPLRSPSPP
jgi:predicted metal-dependent HD superfamily phosphohydrolase